MLIDFKKEIEVAFNEYDDVYYGDVEKIISDIFWDSHVDAEYKIGQQGNVFVVTGIYYTEEYVEVPIDLRITLNPDHRTLKEVEDFTEDKTIFEGR